MGFDFDPDSIAIVGASSDLTRISGLPLHYLEKHGYAGTVYPVNPNHDEIAGRQCYPSIETVPEPPDLAMVMLPASLVVDIVTDCLAIGVENVVIVSSGFSETGTAQGKAWEEELERLAAEHDAFIVGPNSQGMINFVTDVTACFTPALKRDELLTGPVSFVTQSGAFGGALTTLLQEAGIGLNKWIATGNEAAVGALEFVDQLAHDETTDVVVGYVEGFEDARQLIELKRTDAGIDLPFVVLKVGTSERGRAAASSHTGKIAGESAVYEAVLREHGVIAVDDIDILVAVTRLLMETSVESLPRGRLGVISTSGGAGVYIADRADDLGLDLATLATRTRERIGRHLPEYGSATNPVDTTAAVLNSTAAFEECLTALLEDDGVDTLLFQLTNVSGERAAKLADTVCRVKGEYEKPVMVCWTGGVEKTGGIERYRAAGIPVFENPARCLESTAAVGTFVAARPALRASKDSPARVSIPSLDYDRPKKLTEVDAKEVLADYGIETPTERYVTSVDEAVTAAGSIGYPVVVKIVSAAVDHKNRIGGVRLGVEDADAVREAATELLDIGRTVDENVGLTIQRQIEFEHELGLGLTIDDDFGPVLMLGRGGTEIETIDDVTFRTVPVSTAQAERMLEELTTVPVESFTDKQRSSVIDAVTGVSELFLDNRWITEADVNPLVVTADGTVAVDALVTGYEPEAAGGGG
ncbi:acetate--CoA ligase family protein [Halomarina ordinaria]|uniref:acetate--CoA ligase (ADP-forming) n=1 Tax=Halomarina ordinaria TaxID=3033939 RepID=A0ABD5UF92_9EURY|nr:acetate--CoA ligase family protein [Halomarina sp. PSRA2]